MHVTSWVPLQVLLDLQESVISVRLLLLMVELLYNVWWREFKVPCASISMQFHHHQLILCQCARLISNTDVDLPKVFQIGKVLDLNLVVLLLRLLALDIAPSPS